MRSRLVLRHHHSTLRLNVKMTTTFDSVLFSLSPFLKKKNELNMKYAFIPFIFYYPCRQNSGTCLLTCNLHITLKFDMYW